MRKIIQFIVLFVILIFTSCKQEYENWFSETYEMSGEWHVRVLQSVEEYDAIFGSGVMPDLSNLADWTWDDMYGSGYTTVFTYNGADNKPDELLVDDNHTFWDYKVKVNSNLSDLSFEVSDAPNLNYECDISILDGKIMKGAAKAPSGIATDSILFYIKYSDDEVGFTYMRVSGFKKTGFPEDEP